MARKRKSTLVNLEHLNWDKEVTVSEPKPKSKFIIGDDVRDMFRNRGKDARKKD